VRIGRFEIAGVLGSGGMGIVYKAYDPDLGRTIALKMVRTSRADASARHKREARAMAQISHPNVVAIHEVGTHDGELFLVMELVVGSNLADWLKASERTWRETVAMFIAAGRGLAAAHAAGLVHRDFKPHNVLVGEDGRARVTDFGLAREEVSPDASAVAEISPGVAVTPLTAVGQVLGTPAYMAPEQHLGASADARADQFAFAISLWEALHGERPFAGATYAAIRAEVVAGRVREPRNRDVPAFVQRALTRSLAADPDRRWRSMDALLGALATDPRRRWRRLAVGTAALVVVAAAAPVWAHVKASRARAEAVAACATAGQGLASVWDEARKREVQRALLATGAPFAADAWRRVEAELDRYASTLGSTSTRACEDTRVREVVPEAVFEARALCLSWRQLEVRALVDQLVAIDAQTVGRAVSVVGGLEPIEPCLHAEAAEDGRGSASGDWVLSARVAALWPRVAEVRMLWLLGRYREAARETGGALVVATSLDYPPLTARLGGTLGQSLLQLGDIPGARAALTRAAAEAERAHDEHLRMFTLMDLVGALVIDQQHDEEAQRWVSIIDAGLNRLDPRSRCDIASMLADYETVGHGPPAATVARAEAAVRQCEALDPADDAQLAGALDSLAVALQAAGDRDDAARHLQRALALSERALGPEHPATAVYHNNLANCLPSDDETMRVHLLRALEIDERNHLESEVRYDALDGLVSHHMARGEYERAWEYARTERELAARIYGRVSTRSAVALRTGAAALLGLGKLDDALSDARSARPMFASSSGEDVLELAQLDLLMAQVVDKQGQPRRALELAEGALQAYRAHANVKAYVAGYHAVVGELQAELGNSPEAWSHYRAALELIEHEPKRALDPDVLATLTGFGETLIAQGRAGEAVAPLERALARIGTRALDPMVTARTRFALAMALWQSSGDRSRSLELARTARDDYARAESPHARELARVQTWLTGKRVP
jgi:tetratricopeptide (TPR) repeat protein